MESNLRSASNSETRKMVCNNVYERFLGSKSQHINSSDSLHLCLFEQAYKGENLPCTVRK